MMMDQLSKEWLTAREVHKAQLLGDTRSYQAVRLYIQRHWLSAHPTLCRKAAGKGTTLEYHISLFGADAIHQRKKRRGLRDWKPIRGMDVLQNAINGKLREFIRLHVLGQHSMTFSGAEASTLRAACIKEFGEVVFIDEINQIQVPMPPARVFAAYVRWILHQGELIALRQRRSVNGQRL